ncbi:hypothetical protein [Rhizobium sp. RU36D]|uniref:hypothetical protein n=1 Tax=Rhizobium sp. RU36D TaxID=1907415 RepID=UPI0009D8097A|nr:hypothetical protein [Rhizobium sp. RU36D]SMC78077.1 hypothetical protein SAMN05880593_106253 [Rhizobium sp. RU36D]
MKTPSVNSPRDTGISPARTNDTAATIDKFSGLLNLPDRLGEKHYSIAVWLLESGLSALLSRANIGESIDFNKEIHLLIEEGSVYFGFFSVIGAYASTEVFSRDGLNLLDFSKNSKYSPEYIINVKNHHFRVKYNGEEYFAEPLTEAEFGKDDGGVPKDREDGDSLPNKRLSGTFIARAAEEMNDEQWRQLEDVARALLGDTVSPKSEAEELKANIHAKIGSLPGETLGQIWAIVTSPKAKQIPTTAPDGRLYENRPDRSQSAPDFIREVYAEYLDGNFTRADLRRIDPKAEMALRNWESHHRQRADINLPTKKELNDRLLEKPLTVLTPHERLAKGRIQSSRLNNKK